MNPTELPSRLLPLAGADAVQAPAGLSVSAQLRTATGNQLLGLDVWAGTSAAERLLNARTDLYAPSATQLDQLVNHILAPLG
ncbi:hypothetical protein [Dyella flagellata]|uniref:Uncharacterized protein n=1 Tax=Dyella flagellata TaxID=1867833 RepID=A0ABQ5X9A8_9GAMM|nr:hypothetical protein [Dyella flagellata]GLQ87852.1 hypothetical protein GCM10007898_14200 [Dyella flagellata]